MKYFIFFSFVFLFFCSVFLETGCIGNGEEHQKEIFSKNIFFIDSYSNDVEFNEYVLNVFDEYIEPKVRAYLMQNIEHPSYLLDLYIFPLDHKTGFGSPLLYNSVKTGDAKKISDLRSGVDDVIEGMRESLDDKLEKYKNPSSKIKIYPSLVKAHDEFSQIKNSRATNRLNLFYISDFIELDFPSNPNNGRFSFLNKGSNDVDIFNLRSAHNQILDSLSFLQEELYGKINSEVFENVCLGLYKADNIDITFPKESGSYSDLHDFWKACFLKAGFDKKYIHFKSIDEMKDIQL
jgi:hypothetical protein